MLPRDPQDWPSVFTQHLNAGDLEKVISLYEQDARSSRLPAKPLLASSPLGK